MSRHPSAWASISTTHPDPVDHPCSWCAVWHRLGGSWRIEDGAVQLINPDGEMRGVRDAMLADGVRRSLDLVDAAVRRAAAGGSPWAP